MGIVFKCSRCGYSLFVVYDTPYGVWDVIKSKKRCPRCGRRLPLIPEKVIIINGNRTAVFVVEKR